MDNSTSDLQLTEDEFTCLAAFLDANAQMNIEMLDGFFAALISGPDLVLPSEYLAEIWGQEFSFDDDEQASEIIGLLMRHWNAIVAELVRALNEPHVYFPILLEQEDGVAPGNDWAHGFMRGVRMRPGGWNTLIEDDEHGGPMVAIMVLHYEHDPDPEMRPPPIPPEKREELLQAMIAGLTHIYRYFEPYRRAMARVPAQFPMLRGGLKIGRNELCPCGSGRKYKHCCLVSTCTPTTMH